MKPMTKIPSRPEVHIEPYMPDGRRVPFIMTGPEVIAFLRMNVSEASMARTLWGLRHRGLRAMKLSTEICYQLLDVVAFAERMVDEKAR